MGNFIQEISRGFQLAKDWRFSGHTIKLASGEKVSRQRAKQIITAIQQETQQLTRKEIAHWRKANQIAINIENPRRSQLYAIYSDAMHDLHLKGAVRNRKLSVLSQPFFISDQDGNKDVDATALMRSKWFKKLLNHFLDAKFYGATLIQFGDIIRDGKLRFEDVEIVPRHHVIPEYGVVLIKESDEIKQGIDFTKNDWCLLVGDKHDLGELNSVAKEAISKKYILQFWDTFAELFGTPMRTATTTSRDTKDHDAIAATLEGMGAAPWGLFPEGTEFQIIERKQTDSYMVFDKRIARANSEMSKGILGQTMTMDDGSSQSQATVHEQVAEYIRDADSEDILDWVNDELIPFLIGHGWPLQNKEFRWDDSYTYSPKEMQEIEKMILDYFEVDPAYFVDKYGITITGKKQTTALPTTGTTKDKKELNFFDDASV